MSVCKVIFFYIKNKAMREFDFGLQKSSSQKYTLSTRRVCADCFYYLAHMHDSGAFACFSDPGRKRESRQIVEQTEEAHENKNKVVVEREAKATGKRKTPQRTAQRWANGTNKTDTSLSDTIDGSQLLYWSRIIDLWSIKSG